MNIYVITSVNYTKLLPGFAERFEKYWGEPYFIWVSNTDFQHWSDGFLKFLRSITDDYFILLWEDFYLNEPVDKVLLERLKDAVRFNPDRISLLGNHTPERTYFNGEFYVHKPDAEYQFSLEASIQKREYLLKWIKGGWTPWDAEGLNKDRAVGSILSLEKPAIFYQDKSRRLNIDESIT